MHRRHRALVAVLSLAVALLASATTATSAGAAPVDDPADSTEPSQAKAAATERSVLERHWLTSELTAAVDAMVAVAEVTSAAAEVTSQSARGAAPAEPRLCEDIRTPEIPRLVGDIFRCRLAEAGFPQAEVSHIAAEAVTVAQCESGFDPRAVVFGSRYVNARHPGTGSFYTAAGVFQFIRESADRWIQGGYAHVHDAVRNIDAAARLYIHNRQRGYGGWDDWACAAANDGFRATSVLPGWPGGPAQLPAWSWRY